MSYPTERAAICPSCGAKPGKPCYGNGPMPPGSHGGRIFAAYREEIDRLRSQIEELTGKTQSARDKDLKAIAILDELRLDLLGEIEWTRSHFLPGPNSDRACERWQIAAEVIEEHSLSLREDWRL